LYCDFGFVCRRAADYPSDLSCPVYSLSVSGYLMSDSALFHLGNSILSENKFIPIIIRNKKAAVSGGFFCEPQVKMR